MKNQTQQCPFSHQPYQSQRHFQVEPKKKKHSSFVNHSNQPQPINHHTNIAFHSANTGHQTRPGTIPYSITTLRATRCPAVHCTARIIPPSLTDPTNPETSNPQRLKTQGYQTKTHRTHTSRNARISNPVKKQAKPATVAHAP